MRKEKTAIVVGAGVIGLAIGRALQQAGIATTVIEMKQSIENSNSFRNSAVIHAGIYYKPNQLKAMFCRKGAALLYDYCLRNAIAVNKRGKLIVATSKGQLPALAALQENALKNGINDIIALSPKEVYTLEPNIQCQGALLSPSTGVFDVKQFMQQLLKDFVALDGECFFSSQVQSIKKEEKYCIEYSSNGKPAYQYSDYLVNAAGLYAPNVAKTMFFLKQDSIPKPYYAKGNYFRLNMKNYFSKLIYPLPEQAGLGIHATTDIHGVVRFGPDVQWVDTPDNYDVDETRKSSFIEEIKRWFPSVEQYGLEAEFSGIRAKISPAQQQPQDFMIQSAEQHDCDGLVNLYGIESPGLTSSLAIAEYVVETLSNIMLYFPPYFEPSFRSKP